VADDRAVGWMCSRSRRAGNRCRPVTRADVEAGRDLAWLMSTRATQTHRTAACPHPCPGGCGGWVPVPSLCIDCWLARQSYAPQQVRDLPADDPRRQRIRR